MGSASLLLLFLALGFATAIGMDSAMFPHSGSAMVEPEEEMLMDSEASRRILYQRTYISYEALKKDNVPCNQRGAPYYNCQAGGKANIYYSRGCLKITHCERVTS